MIHLYLFDFLVFSFVIYLLLVGEEGQVVRLIAVPSFFKTKCAVIVDLETLDTQTISFGAS